MKRLLSWSLVLLLIIILTVGVKGEEESIGEAEPSQAVHIRAGYLRQLDDLVELSEGVTIIRRDNTVTAPWAELFRDDNKAILYDGVKLEHSEGEIEGQMLTAWLDEEEYIFEDDVELWQHGEGDEFSLQSSYLKLFGEDNSFWTDQRVLIDYDGRNISGKEANYDGSKRELELLDDVYIEEENGDWIRGNRALFYLGDEEGFIMDGGIEMEIKLSE